MNNDPYFEWLHRIGVKINDPEFLDWLNTQFEPSAQDGLDSQGEPMAHFETPIQVSVIKTDLLVNGIKAGEGDVVWNLKNQEAFKNKGSLIL